MRFLPVPIHPIMRSAHISSFILICKIMFVVCFCFCSIFLFQAMTDFLVPKHVRIWCTVQYA